MRPRAEAVRDESREREERSSPEAEGPCSYVASPHRARPHDAAVIMWCVALLLLMMMMLNEPQNVRICEFGVRWGLLLGASGLSGARHRRVNTPAEVKCGVLRPAW